MVDGLAAKVLIHTLGDHWQPEGSVRTPLGDVVTRAKEHRDADAVAELGAMVGRWATTIGLPSDAVVTSVAPSPVRDDQLVHALAHSVASGLGLTLRLELVTRRFVTPRLRDTEPTERSAVARAAGYEIGSDVKGRAVILVDDVVLTGTTIRHIAELLLSAGAARVVGLAVTQTRRESTSLILLDKPSD